MLSVSRVQWRDNLSSQFGFKVMLEYFSVEWIYSLTVLCWFEELEGLCVVLAMYMIPVLNCFRRCSVWLLWVIGSDKSEKVERWCVGHSWLYLALSLLQNLSEVEYLQLFQNSLWRFSNSWNSCNYFTHDVFLSNFYKIRFTLGMAEESKGPKLSALFNTEK